MDHPCCEDVVYKSLTCLVVIMQGVKFIKHPCSKDLVTDSFFPSRFQFPCRSGSNNTCVHIM